MLRRMVARAVVLTHKMCRIGDGDKIAQTIQDAKPKRKSKTKPKQVIAVPPSTCAHTSIKRRGNATGRYATCNDCQSRWKWVEDGETRGWRFHPSSKSCALPLPSAQTVVDASWTPASSSAGPPPGSMPKIRPRPISATSASGYHGTTAAVMEIHDSDEEETDSENDYDWAVVQDW